MSKREELQAATDAAYEAWEKAQAELYAFDLNAAQQPHTEQERLFQRIYNREISSINEQLKIAKTAMETATAYADYHGVPFQYVTLHGESVYVPPSFHDIWSDVRPDFVEVATGINSAWLGEGWDPSND